MHDEALAEATVESFIADEGGVGATSAHAHAHDQEVGGALAM